MGSWMKFRSTKYLKKDEFKRPVIAVIKSIQEQNVAKDGEPPKPRLVCYFDELDKGLVLNTSICQSLNTLADLEEDSDDTDAWIGMTVEIFNDESISFRGKRIGGLRVRQPESQPY
jgi:hypothetical protein